MISRCLRAWSSFWFSPVPLLNLAVFRLILTAALLVMYISRHSSIQLFFSDEGILPKSLALEVLPEFYRPAINLSFWPDSMLFLVHGIFLLSLLLVFLGVGNRIVSAGVGIFCVYLDQAFMQRNMGVLFGADQIGGIFLMYLALTNHNQYLSLSSWLKKSKKTADQMSADSDLLTSMFYRLIQVHLCIIYAYTGFEKLKGASWWDGTALWSVFANPQFVVADLTWVRHLPGVIAIVSFSTILFEIYFPALVWVKATRKPLLVLGVLFHSSIALLMALHSFAMIMLAPYILFVSPDFIAASLKRLKLRFF